MINQIKKLTLTVFVLLISTNIYAQVPQGFNFQAVARGTDGIPLINQDLGVQVSVLSGSETGIAVYTEAHTVTTNGVGLIQLVIGEGTAAEGNDFSSVDWGSDNFYVKLEIDPAGGTEYEELGTSRLLSVPYALLAENVVNGGGSAGEFPLEINLNTANADSSLIINIEGDKTAKPLQVFSKSSGFNGAIWGEAISDASNPNDQRGTYGMANGLGTGGHFGLFGGAVNFEATEGIRRGVHGQAASKAKYNYGVFGLAAGDGNGESETDPENGDFGSFNLGGYFQSNGNLNGNVGAEGVTAGSNGNLRNFGLIGTARTFASGRNIGLRAEAFGSTTENTGAEAVASGDNSNVGLRAEARNGTSNIAIIADADTAAILNGDVIINGALIHNGSSSGSGSVSQYNFDTGNPDSSFTVNVSGTNGGAAIISTSSTDGTNSGLEAYAKSNSGNTALQVGSYGDARGSGTGDHLGVYGIAFGDESVSGDVGRRYGLYGFARSTGRENIGGFGIGRGAGDGEIVALGDEFAGGSFNVGGFNIGFVGFARDNVNGNIGLRGYVYGDQGARENRAVAAEAVSTSSGRNVGVQSIVHSSQTNNIAFQALMFDGGTGVSSERNHGLDIDVSNASTVMNRGIYASVNGTSLDNHGIQVDVSGGTNSNIGLIVNAATAAELNGAVYVNGDLNYSGALNNTSDRNLKENIKPLENGLETIMKLNPTTYNFRGNGEYNGLKLSTGLHYGLIAQEVEEVIPSLVKDNVHYYEEGVSTVSGPSETSDEKIVKSMDYKTMNYTELIPVLIKAVQEQQEEIERLTKEVERLKSEKK